MVKATIADSSFRQGSDEVAGTSLKKGVWPRWIHDKFMPKAPMEDTNTMPAASYEESASALAPGS